MSMKKKIISILLSVLLLMTTVIAVPIVTGAVTESYSIGNCNWTLNGTELTVSGSGAIGDLDDDYWNCPPQNYWSRYVTKITISEGITAIGDYAFYGFMSLKDITIPESVKKIGSHAFFNAKFTDLKIPNGVSEIGDCAFLNCTELRFLTLPENLNVVGRRAFYSCTKIYSVTLPDSLSSIGDQAFGYYSLPYYVDDFKHYGFSIKANTATAAEKYAKDNGFMFFPLDPEPAEPEDKQNIISSGTTGDCEWKLSDKGVFTVSGSGAMKDYNTFGNIDPAPWGYDISEVVIKDGVSTVGNGAFNNRTNLHKVTIPDTVTSIGSGAFSSCLFLEEIRLCSSIKSIGTSAFSGTGITEIDIPYGVEAIEGSTFYGCSRLTNVKLPNSVKSIGMYAFVDCTNLANINIPASVTTIGAYAFLNSSYLNSVTVPESVTEIGDKALGYYYTQSANDPLKLPDFTIRGYKGSAAEKYAKKNGLTFIAVSDTPSEPAGPSTPDEPKPVVSSMIIGDADNDGEVTILDATTIQRNLAGLPNDSFDKNNADADEDAEVTILDATAIQRHLASLESNPHIGTRILE